MRSRERHTSPACCWRSSGCRACRPGSPSAWKACSSVAELQLEIAEGDITALEVDAIANAANNALWMGAGVAGAIKRAGGEEIEREAVAKGPDEICDAVATRGGGVEGKNRIYRG